MRDYRLSGKGDCMDEIFKLCVYAISIGILEAAFLFFSYGITLIRMPKTDYKKVDHDAELLDYYLNLYGKPIFGLLNIIAICALFVIVRNDYLGI